MAGLGALARPALADSLSGSGRTLAPAAAGAGGAEDSTSSSFRLSGSAGEISFSTAAATSVARGGLLQARSSPGPATAVAAVSVASTSLAVTWNAPGYDGGLGAHLPGTRYLVQYDSMPATSFWYDKAAVAISTSGALPGDAQSARLSGLWPNSTYYVELWTQDADGDVSSGSARAVAPTAPVLVSTFQYKSVYVTSFTVTWPALPPSPSSATCEGYRLEASTSQFAGGTVFSSTTYSVAQTTLTLTSLSPQTTYYVRVVSLGWDGLAGSVYPQGSVYTSTTTRFQEVPPANVHAAPTANSMLMTWTTVNAPQGYHVQASTASDFTGGGASVHVGPSGVSQNLTGLLPNTTYFLRVGSVWDSGTTNYASALATATWANAPSGAAYSNVMITSVTVGWQAFPSSPPDASSKTAEGYALEASTASDYSGVVFSSRSLALAQTALTVSGLAVNTTYYVRAGSLNWQGATDYVLLSATSTLASPPGLAAPAFTGVFATSVSAQWTAGTPANPGGTTYTLRASSKAFAAGEVVVTSDSVSLAGTVPGLQSDTTYELRVLTLNNNSLPAETVLGTTVTLAQPPVAPTVAAVYSASVTVTWTTTTAQGYVLEASSTNFGALLPGGTTLSSATANGSDPGLTVLSLAANTTYYLRVAALNWSSARSYATVPATSTLPSPISALQRYAVFSTSITLNWNPLPASPQAAASEGYRVEASTTDFGLLSPGGVVYASATPNVALATLTVSGLSPDATYYLRAGSVNWVGGANFVAAAATSTLASPVSPAFSALYVTSTTVSWTPVAGQGYRLDASASPTFSPLFFSSTAAGGTTSLTVTGLSADTTYYYRVGSLDWNNAPDYAGLGPLSTLALPPSAPLYPGNGVFFTSGTVQWTAVTSQGYRVDASTAADYNGTVFSSATPNGAATSLVVSGLDSGTTYYFRVGSLNWNSAADYAVLAATRTLLSPKTWTGATDSLWNTATNWNPSGVPGKTDAVTIAVAANVSAAGTEISFSSLTIGSPAGAAVALTLSTTVANGGNVIVYNNAGLTIATNRTVSLSGDLTLLTGSTLSHADNGASITSDVDLVVAGAFNLQAGATVAVAGLGFNGGAANFAGSGPGAGGGTSVNNTGGGGGGHGGNGSGGTGGSGGSSYDSPVNPANAGAGGGGGRIAAGTGQPGGSGGGLAKVSAQTMNIFGLVSADGSDGGSGSGSGGGGAGGGVNLTAQVFAGTGTVSARGGAGGAALGGGGGGGLVSVNVTLSGSACSLTFDVAGGTGTASSGGNGVVSTTATIIAPAGFSGVVLSTGDIAWSWSLANGAVNYQLFSSTGGNGQSPLLSSLTTTYVAAGLLANTTAGFFVRAFSCGQSADSAAFPLTTKPLAPAALAPAFVSAAPDSLSVQWSKLPASPQELSAEGYRLDVSTASDFSGTLTSSSVFSASQSTLAASGLLSNTTYFARVASLAWDGSLSSFTVLGATSTLAATPSLLAYDYLAIYPTSATLRWAALPAAPSSATSEGYVLEASTTNFGALSPGGVVLSSITRSVAASTLTVTGLDESTTVYFRVGSLNHGSVPDYRDLLRLWVQVTPSLVNLSLGNMDPAVSLSTVSVLSYAVANTGTVPVSFALWASTATPLSPWTLGAAPGVETVVLQGLWNTAQPVGGAFSAPITGSTTTSTGAVYAGDQNGMSVPAGATRTMWFRFTLPTSTAVDNITQILQLGVAPVYP